MTCRSIQRFCGAHPTHQALTPSSPIWLSPKLMPVTDAFIFSASARAWRQQQIKAGILFVVLPSKPDHWNPSNNWHSSEKCRISLQAWKNNPEIHIFIQHLHICWQLNSINLSLSQDGWKVTSWDTAAFNDSTETNAHQALAPSAPIWLFHKAMFVTHLLILSASAKAWRQQQIKVGVLFVVLPSKPDHWNPSNNWHSSEKCRISLQTWKNNPEIHIFIQHLHICWQLNSINLSLSQDGWKVTSWDTAAFNDSTETNAHQALAPSAPIWLFHKAMFVTHLLILSASAKAWRQQQIKVGVLFVVLPSKPDHWNPSNNWHSSEKWRISLIQTWKSNPEIHIFIQHLHTVWHTAGLGVFDNSTRSEMNDETTAPANHPNFSL